jgi:threonine/homoserine/homoserine lactone efflux protein
LSKVADYAPGTILVPFFLILFPLSLLGFILSDYVQQISQYKKIFSIASVALLVYSAIGLVLAANPSTPDVSKEIEELGNTAGELGAIANQAAKMANEAIKDVISIGWGFYLAVITTFASAFLYFKQK